MYQGKKIYVCDIEADGLLDTITKIWVLGYGTPKEDGTWDIGTTTSYDAIKRLFENENNVIIGHNFATYDVPAVVKVLGINVKAKIVDTLAISYALFPNRPQSQHNLADWGETLGVSKPEVGEKEWVGIGEVKESILSYYRGEEVKSSPELESFKALSDDDKSAMVSDIQAEKKAHQELMEHRVTEDVKINVLLWTQMKTKLKSIYEEDMEDAERFCNYMTFKADCLREQEEHPLHIDIDSCRETIQRFEEMKQEKIKALIPAMPKTPVKSKKTRPKKPFKKDGSLSATGKRWFDMIDELGLPQDYDGEIEVITKWAEPNPNSSDQVKKWLFEMGWKPKIYKDGTNGKVPQLRNSSKELCESVMKLSKKEPAILELEGISVLTHRIGALKSFDKNLREGNTVVARASSYANTLRLQHSAPITNLPSVITKGPDKGGIKDGKWIRGVIVPPEGKIICGSDMSSLEDRMKQHYIFPYDPEYVKDMMTDDFDPHLDLAIAAGMLTQDQVTAHKKGEENYSEVRSVAKTSNYALQYGCGVPKLAESANITQGEAAKLKDSYWERNWAVRKAGEDMEVKTVDEELWMKNPVNNFYYNLRNEKDRMSLACQGGGTYVFDMWLYYVRSKGVKISMQYHDEKLAYLPDTEQDRERVEKVLKWAVGQVNKTLGLRRNMDVDVQFGKSYADVH